MAVSNKFTQKSLFGGGSTKSNTPKIDTSYGANLGGGQQNNIVNLPTLSSGVNSGGLTAAPQNLTYQNNLKNMTGIIGQGGASGGVTDEGVIVGNPNVEKMPRINRNGSSSHQFKTFGQLVDETGKDLTSYAANGISEGTTVQESVLRIGTPEWDAVMNPENKRTLPYMISQNSEGTAGDGTKITHAANGIGGDTGGGTPPTGNSGTGSTGATGGSTAGSGEVDTYEEFLLKQEGFYKEQLDKLNAQIEQNKQNALQQAESERERAVIDARSSYEQNKATYGANAEQLAAMGLSGSGYSDYLNQQAYATQRAETQNANAQAEATKLAAEQQANSDKLNAELSYAENMQGNAEKLAQYQQQKAEEAKAEEEQKKQYYAALLTSANTGEYTSEQIASLGAQYGLDEVQISQLQAAADKYKSDQQSLSYTEALQMISDYGADLDVSYLETLLNTGSISQEQYNQLMAQYSKELVESGDVATEDTDKIDDLHQGGQISDEDYNKQKEQWNSQIDTSDAFFNSGSMSATEAKKQLDEILNSEWTSEENKKALQKTYDNLYKIVQNDVKFNNDGGWWIFGSTDMGEAGNNFSVKDGSGFVYRIESGGEVTDEVINSLASGVSNGSVFGVRGQIYYKKDGKVYLIQKRENSYGDHYTKLYNKFFG